MLVGEVKGACVEVGGACYEMLGGGEGCLWAGFISFSNYLFKN